MIDTAPLSKKRITHDEAWLYIATLTYNNYTDWRMPTESEYNSSPELEEYAWCWVEGREVYSQGTNEPRLKALPVRNKDD